MTEKKINAPYDNPFGIWHETKTKEEKRQEVLAKLSPEERQILGLEEPKQ